MSTPLIFMTVSQFLKRAGRALTAPSVPGKEGIGIDGRAFPPALARLHAVDGEMEVGPFGVGIAGAADAAKRRAAGHALPFLEARRVAGEMGLGVGPGLVGRPDLNGAPAARSPEKQKSER